MIIGMNEKIVRKKYVEIRVWLIWYGIFIGYCVSEKGDDDKI